MILRYEIIYGIVDYILHHPEETYDDYIDFAGSFGFSEATSKFWIDLFLDTICKYLVVESTVDNARGWLIKQMDSGIAIDGLCDRLVAMLSATWEQEEEIIVTKDGEVYRDIIKCKSGTSSNSVDLIVEKHGVKWLLTGAFFVGSKLSYVSATPSELQSLISEKEELEGKLKTFPSDTDLLNWAKEHYPGMSDINKFQQRLVDVQAKIDTLSNLSFED